MLNTTKTNPWGKAPNDSHIKTIELRHNDNATSFNLEELIEQLPPTLRQCITLLDNYEERKIATML
jgi:hypothetical protein